MKKLPIQLSWGIAYPELAFIMNLLAAMGAYCFFATKPEVNFEYEVPESNGQIVLWQ